MLTEPIKPRSIPKKCLSFEIPKVARDGGQGRGQGTGEVKRETLTLAEDADFMTVLGIDENGLGIKASASDCIPAVAIAMQRGVAGAKINVASHELKDIVNTCTPGAELFLGENGQITETPAMTTGVIFQSLGRALNATKIAIDVDLPYDVK